MLQKPETLRITYALLCLERDLQRSLHSYPVNASSRSNLTADGETFIFILGIVRSKNY